MEEQSKKIALLILNWNGVKLLEKYLPSVVKYNSSDAEIIVIDNASEDNSILFLKNTYPDIKRIEFKENYGFAKGYNKAINLIPHQYVVLLNSDELASLILVIFLAASITASCIPKQIPKYGILLILA